MNPPYLHFIYNQLEKLAEFPGVGITTKGPADRHGSYAPASR